MTLSARIAVVPARRLAVVTTLLPVAGCVVAATTAVERWPAAVAAIGACAALAAVLLAIRTLRHFRRTGAPVLVLSERADLDVVPDPLGDAGPWRLAASTVVWPDFSMLALRKADPTLDRSHHHVPVVHATLSRDDRRRLGRYLTWMLRTGAGRPDGTSVGSGRP